MENPFKGVTPLPAEIRPSLIAMATLGMISLVTASSLIAHITHKLILWKIRDSRNKRNFERATGLAPKAGSIDLNMGLAEDHYYKTKTTRGDSKDPVLSPTPHEVLRSETTLANLKDDKEPAPAPSPPSSTGREKPPNPLLLLIYNLVLADITLSASYAADVAWLVMDGIIAPSATCSAQGWIVGFGCLTTSGFLLTISVFSYLGIIRGYKATTRDVIIACSVVWSLALLLASIGPMRFRDSSFYGRETAWVSFCLGFQHVPL